MSPTQWLAGDLEHEFSTARLGDPRREKRLLEITSRLAKDPQASFPKAFNKQADQEGFYRFVRNEAFGWKDIFAGHAKASLERARQFGTCLCLHDTTDFSFRGDRDGLERTSSSAKGFFSHVSLLIGADEARTPLGVAAIEQYVRKGRGRRVDTAEIRANGTEESRRWERNIIEVEKARDEQFDCIHVADREADALRLLHLLTERNVRFVIRVSRDRVLEDEFGDIERLHEILARIEPRSAFDVAVSTRGKHRSPQSARSHPPRGERVARVSIGACSVVVTSAPVRVNEFETAAG